MNHKRQTKTILGQFSLWSILLVVLLSGCKKLDTTNENNPDRTAVLSTGSDLINVLEGAYGTWWQAVHGAHPVIAVSVASDAYGLSWADFGAERMGKEPRVAYNNQLSEENDYRQILEDPWYGCLSAATSANDVLDALDRGVSIDGGGAQDESIRAAAHLLRGLSWGYLGLIFDKAFLVEEEFNFEGELPFLNYFQVIEAAVTDLEEAARIAGTTGSDFIHTAFNGLTLGDTQFRQICHSYAARFLAQWPRTVSQRDEVNWAAVLAHAEQGLEFDFAPLADGNQWQSYQKFTFAETGQGPFWARIDQRIIAALDPDQPVRYPEVAALGEEPLTDTEISSSDQRVSTDFVYLPNQSFPVDRGEWHFSHYKNQRNTADPSFAGDATTFGPMPVFLASDNTLLKAEALLFLGRTSEALNEINSGTRTTRGGLPAIGLGSSVGEIAQAIMYERCVELIGTAPMNIWFYRRRIGPRENRNTLTALGGLQEGTPAHLPIPAKELRLFGQATYNFGGEEDPEGIVPF